ncbi:hypothetical protein CERSUDRAFT_125402 [Gelatoporia subvermispora B]|uniref:Uncharacterized protein n=1 Tax=Ceriporiopsis subvermispora (strain B) TaxID=914234 RepID=M2QCX4_CERS8|nr:hypothetical protein CERSUDRAFT_125402 [Gelatoporia subvermispora B]
MDDVGYLIFRGKTIGLHLCRSVRCLEHVHLVDNHGYLWIFIDPEYNSNISTTPPEAFAVVVGYDPNAGAIKALLLKEHHQDHFHIESYFTMSGEHYAELTKNWEVREFSVGGTEMRQKLSSRKVLESLKQAQFEINADQPSDTEGTNEPSDRQKSAIQRINDNFADVFNLQEIVPFDPLSNEFQGYWQERMSKETRFRQVLQEGIHEFSGPLSPSLPVPSSEDREDSWEFQDLYDLVQKFSGKLGKQEKDNDGFTISRRLPEFHFESMFAQDDWKDLEDEQAAYSARFERTFESELWTEAGLIETRQSLHQNSALEEAHLNEDCYDTDEI